MHCTTEPDEDGIDQLKTIGHDFEGFVAEIERYGLWRDNAKKMATAMQPHLPFDGDNDVEIEISAGGKTAKTSVAAMKQVASRLPQSAALH
jgi:hypothetical protein